MNNLYSSGGIRSKLRTTMLACLAALPAWLHAQVSIYSFSQSVPGYTEISDADGGYLLGTPTFDPPQHNMRVYVDPALPEGTITNGGYLGAGQGPGYPIGFNFTFNGEVFDRIGISNLGWVSFGKSADGNVAVWTYAGDHQHARPFVQFYGGPPVPYRRNRVAGFANSGLRAQDMTVLGGPISSLRITTIGTAPNRVCVVQWKDFRANYSYDGDKNRINFQIRLNEADNSVEVRYGYMKWGASLGVQVGLGGAVTEDYNSRMTNSQEPTFSHDWNATIPGTVNESMCYANNPVWDQSSGSGIYPVIGTSFKWSPPTCPPPAWPLTMTGVTFHNATASWGVVPGVTTYDYRLTKVPDVNATAVASGTITGNSFTFEGLDTLTYYYAFVRAHCGATPGTWGLATEFRTQGGAFLVCGGALEQQYYCTDQHSAVTWHYHSDDNESPVRISFQQGYVGGTVDEFFRIHDGPSASAPLLYDAEWGDVLPGQVFTSTGPDLFINTANGQGSCHSQPWYTPWRWTVGCKNCTEPLAIYNVVNTDCAAQEYEVQVMLVSIGSSTTMNILNSQGVAATAVSGGGMYTVGPFTAGLPVTLTFENPDNALCNVTTVQLVNEPCAIVGCGPEENSFCFDQNDQRQWLYQGEGAPIGIRFIQGGVGYYADAFTYDALDPFSVNGVALDGDLANVIRTSTNPDHALMVELTVDQFAAWTCANGEVQEWQYVVACYDGCTQPTASFSRAECATPSFYHVAVNITQLGSTGSVMITNDGGAPTVVATSTGVYQVGPFASGSTVRVEVEGASPLCTWSSSKLTYSCLTMAVEELNTSSLQLYPNPNDGRMRIVLPSDLAGTADLEVMDLSGRAMHRERVSATNAGEVTLELTDLPNGLYLVQLRTDDSRYLGKLTIQH